MKKAIFIIVALALSTALPAQVKVNKEKPQAVPLNMEQNRCYTGFEFEQDEYLPPLSAPNKMIPSNQFYSLIGQTHYSLPTNRNSRNTIGFKPKSTDGAAVWTTSTMVSASRGTGINYYHVNENLWDPILASDERIESVRTGWGTHGFTHDGEVVVAHNGVDGLTVNTRNMVGQGTWQQSTLLGPQYLLAPTQSMPGVATTSILWPTMATHKNTVHIVCVTDQWPAPITYPPNYEPNPDVHPHGYLGFTTLPLYYRSTDGGITWEAPRDFREYGMTNFECFRISGDSYVLAVRENHVVLLYHDKIGFINYMESKDGGDTWVKKTVYDFGLEFDQSANAEPRLVPTTAAVFIDEDHKVHVAFGTQCFLKEAGQGYYYPNLPIGMVYWNDAHEPINWQELRGWRNGRTLEDWNWEEYPGYITLPSVLGFDKFYQWMSGPDYNTEAFSNNGWAIYPRIIAKDGRVYLSYQSPLDWPLSSGNNFFRGIFITVSEDNGETWDVQNNTSWVSYFPELFHVIWDNYDEPIYNPDDTWTWDPNSIIIGTATENAYPSMSYNYKGNLFMLQWYHQEFPFVDLANLFVFDPILLFTFTQDLRNIPAYKNIREVYKGWWNGTDSEIEFPPTACERPVELTGTCNGSEVILNWEEPDYMSEPLLGYNIFLNGEKVNESPITEAHYVDTDLAVGPYHYRVSAVYQNCESSLTYPVTLCETPVKLSGRVYENNVIIFWSELGNSICVLGYNIYRDGDMINESLITNKSYIDENLVFGTYLYQVSAVYEFCESSLTDEFSIYVPQFCEKPLDISGTNRENSAVITWNEPENIDGVLVGYIIYRDEVMMNRLPATVREYIDEKLAIGTYFYHVSAIYEHCVSELTNGVSVEITVGITGFTTASFNIYPNPTTGNVTFEGAGLNRVEIFEIQGRKLAGYENVNGVLQINVNQYPNGIYFVKMYTNDYQAVTKRLIILK